MIEQNLEDYDGVIAVLDCKYVGGSAYLWTEHDVYKMKIFDCANPLDGGDDWMNQNSVVGEVGYDFWQRNPDLVLSEEVALMIGCDDFERDELCMFMEDTSNQ